MSWEFELRDEIRLISPYNKFHYAKWRANERTFEKKLGIFEPPNFQGSIVQDMNVKSTIYPLTLYFDGMNHHRNADDFYKSCREEIGQWEVTHPVRGPLILQLVSYKEIMDPVNAGNYTIIETNWIEPTNVERLASLDSTILSTLLAIANFIVDSIATLKQLRADIYSGIAAVADTLNKIANLADSIIAEIAATEALALDAFNILRASFNNAINNFGIDDPDPEDSAQALSDLVAAPVEASTDFSSTFAKYNTYIDSLAELAPESSTPTDFNTALSQEFGIGAAVAAMIKLIIYADFNSRADVVTAMDNLTELWNTVINIFEDIQDNFQGQYIDNQYFSFSQSYNSFLKMFSLAMQYLIQQFYNLKTEKRFILKNPRSPLEITVTEYGSLGEDDENYNLFLESNQLTGNEIFILPAGREVVIYE